MKNNKHSLTKKEFDQKWFIGQSGGYDRDYFWNLLQKEREQYFGEALDKKYEEVKNLYNQELGKQAKKKINAKLVLLRELLIECGYFDQEQGDR